MKTPLNTAIEQMEFAIESSKKLMHEKSGTDEAVMIGLVLFQQDFLAYLQSLLPSERAAIEGAWDDRLEDIRLMDIGCMPKHKTAQDYFNQKYEQ